MNLAKKKLVGVLTGLLALACTKAQTPFTGTVVYKLKMARQADIPKQCTVHYRRQYVLLEAAVENKAGQSATENLVLDFVTGHVYQISHQAKTIVQRNIMVPVTDELRLADRPIDRDTIANVRASAYQGTLRGGGACTVWLADSLPLAIPPGLKNLNDLFVWCMDRLLLRLNIPDDPMGYTMAMLIEAVEVASAPPTDSLFRLPKGYTFTDQVQVQKIQDSLLRAFKQVDSLLGGSLNMDSAMKLLAPVSAPPPQPAKPSKKGPARRTSSPARPPKKQ